MNNNFEDVKENNYNGIVKEETIVTNSTCISEVSDDEHDDEIYYSNKLCKGISEDQLEVFVSQKLKTATKTSSTNLKDTNKRRGGLIAN